MLNPKLIISDIDGTLLKNSRMIPKKIVSEIKRIQKKGVYFSFATGRPLAALKHILSQLTPNAPIISNSGFDIYYPNSNTIKNFNRFDPNWLKSMIEYFLSQHIDIRIVKYNKVYADFSLINKKNDLFFKNYKNIFKDISEANYQNVGKFSFHATSKKETKLIMDKLLTLKEFKELKATIIEDSFDSSFFIDVLPKKTNKGKALRYLQMELNIKIKDTVIIINDDNDLDMIKYCEFIVAPEDATKKIKLKADMIVKKAENLGALEYLKSL